MNLNDVHHGIHKNKARKRIGRGPGSGQGKTAGRGHKGQGSRSGSSTSPIFEGGQMPLVRRIPKRGFTNRFADVVAIVNLASLEKNFQSGEEVSPDTIRDKGLVKGSYDVLKVLAKGELTKSFGSTNPTNLVKATIEALQQLRSQGEVERLRGVSLS